MNTLTDRLQAVQEQVTRLVREHEELRQRLADLDAEVHETPPEGGCVEGPCGRAGTGERGPPERALRWWRNDRPGTKERIDELVNEIDHCLALLKA
jgi:hypothetical protein